VELPYFEILNHFIVESSLNVALFLIALNNCIYAINFIVPLKYKKTLPLSSSSEFFHPIKQSEKYFLLLAVGFTTVV
jgi:hypothetical protein